MRKSSVRTKIISIIVVSLVVTILVILFVSTRIQRNNLQSANEKTLATSTAMLNITIRNLMLNGEAPIAVRTITDLQNVQDLKEVEIYRTDGSRAFHDHTTLETVNRNLKKPFFKRTARLPNKVIDNDYFRAVLESETPRRVELKSRREMEYYFPILNLPECRACHGAGHFVRGVAYFRLSTRKVHEQIVESNVILAGIFIAAGTFLGIVLVLFLKRVIVLPLLQIGNAVRRVAGGDLQTRVSVRSRDELGELGDEINTMIKGLEERFHLSKYVSKGTQALIREKGGAAGEGERRQLTTLFSDIRSFTAFAEKHPPQDVVENLNRILQAQAEVVERWGGDVDKFVGDAVMALFTDPYRAVQCAYQMVRAVVAVDREYGTGLFVGVGMSSGEVILGNVGGANRLEYAAIGDAVNLASRLSGIAKPNMILLSEDIVESLPGKVRAKLIPGRKIKGKSARVNFYVLESVLDEHTGRWIS